MKRILLVSIVAVLVFGFALPAFALVRCDNCNMKVPDDSRYAVTITLKDGSKKLLCSIYCASMVRERLGADAAGMTVVDFGTGEELKAEDAVWVEGGDVRSVMSDKPRIAFKDKSSADAFVKEHGGRVVGFADAYKDSVEEWKDR